MKLNHITILGALAGLGFAILASGQYTATSPTKIAQTGSVIILGTVPMSQPLPLQVPPPQEPTPTAPVVDLSSHQAVMVAAGIAESDWPYVEYIVSHESSWNQEATEPTTGAHGLVQALPFSKTGCGWDDAVCTLQWGSSYAQKYGGWQGAYQFWSQNRWW